MQGVHAGISARVRDVLLGAIDGLVRSLIILMHQTYAIPAGTCLGMREAGAGIRMALKSLF
jgi:hypothetical protein